MKDPWLDELSEALWAKPQFSMVPIDYEGVPTRPYAGPALSTEGLRVVFVGIPSDYGTSFLLHLVQERVNLVAVVCSTRWQRTHPKPDLVARIASHLGRPVEVAANVNALPFVRSLSHYQPDLVIMASFDQILSTQPLAVPRLGWMNIHPSLLPWHRGPEPIYWTIERGERESGITLLWTVPRIDAGPILAQRRAPVFPDDTSGTLCKRLVHAGLEALDQTVGHLAAGGPVDTVVPDVRKGSYEPPVHPNALDWDQPFERIDRLVRAGQPDQPPYFQHGSERLYVEGVRRVSASRGERPGILQPPGDGQMRAAIADAVVEVAWRRTGHSHALRPLRRQHFP